MSEEIDQEVVEQLRASYKAHGARDKVVKSSEGEVVDGHQRKAAVPDWPEEVNVNLKTTEDIIIYQIDKNWNRTSKSETWKREKIANLAKLGHDVGWIVNETGFSERTIYRYFPTDLKDETKVAAGKVGGEVSAAKLSAKSQDSIQALVHCDGCKTPRRDVHSWHGRLDLCPDCTKKANGNPEVFEHAASVKNGQAKLLAKIPEAKPQSPMQMTRYGDRVEMMKVQHGAMEEKIVRKLRAKGFKVTTGQKIVVYQVETEPDFNIELPNGKAVHGYIDHVETHKAKQIGRDDELRGLLQKTEPTSRIVPVWVKGDSEKEADEKVAEIEQEMKF